MNKKTNCVTKYKTWDYNIYYMAENSCRMVKDDLESLVSIDLKLSWDWQELGKSVETDQHWTSC